MASEEKDKGFTVQDRRRFSAEGEAKADGPEETRAPAAASAPEAAAAERRRDAAPEPPEEPEVTFTTFMVGLSTQALAALGEISDPVSGARSKDLQAAQQLIDIIGMLREKTRGNLDRDEDGLIEAILFDLRMKYVELARQSAR
ncbi:MAG TPA: DUF1844 domain-containing protein [Candidatus Binataceae bacterium]|jgi:hypothetical protein